jgi:transcription-repair coupling factor (superfamily II helicase)
MKTEAISTRLENILEREFEIGSTDILIHGSSSPMALSFFLSQSHSKKINDLPHLVVVPSLADANRFQQILDAFDPLRQSVLLPAFDVSPYSGLYPSPHTVAERLSFLARTREAKPGDIFVSTIDALSQKTLPRKVFDSFSRRLRTGDELPDELGTWLDDIGYQSAPIVEDRGQYAVRGGIVDIWSPAEVQPIRLELFGDQIETLRFFSPTDQRSLSETAQLNLIPARETLYLENQYENLIERIRADLKARAVPTHESEEILRSLIHRQFFPGIEFLLPFIYEKLESPLEYFETPLNFWSLDTESIERSLDDFLTELRSDEAAAKQAPIRPPLADLFAGLEDLKPTKRGRNLKVSLLDTFGGNDSLRRVGYSTYSTQDLAQLGQSIAFGTEPWFQAFKSKISKWKEDGYRIFVALRTGPPFERLAYALERMDLKPVKCSQDELLWDQWLAEQDRDLNLIHLIPKTFAESLRLDEEKIIFLREDDFFGKKERRRATTGAEDFQTQAKRLAFGDLKPGDLVVHVKHGIGQYEGLKIMPIGGVENEFIQLSYKDKDKLYLPVYRVGQLQKYSGATATTILDRLGGTAWEKTKSKVRSHLRDIAAELLAFYAKRAEAHRPAFQLNESDILQFEKGFPYEETDDQLRAINDIQKDLQSTKPMDRLICGDVGFGKTEVAMRAAFFAIQDRKQVAVLAPTTVLTFQHFETFKKRFQGWPVEIRVLNRFVPTADAKKTIKDAKDGKVDILIGTHKLFGKDIGFKDLGLLVIDEEQKFGVAHKEKIRRFKVSVDTLTLSATPIPRTLNMGFVGVRDLSLINTAPVDRLPTRTFICKWEEETIRKSITSEIARGGQVYFIHNRIQSIYGLADDIRRIVPDARIRVAHGQMNEEELEKNMLDFFNHDVDVLICTAIVESGMDVSRANTMFIDRADLFGLSQLYQLRGRVGRSKLRAYCYLILPKDRKLDKHAQERLRVIQENTALGSGIRIAQYDLELRGAGSILGEEQSGHVDSVGYELYMELLNEALADAKGESIDNAELDPEINLRIQAMIPEIYIQDVRIRLSYYKALAEIRSEEDLEKIGDELRDQFGALPEPVLNLMGLMLIRRLCKDLGIRDVSAGLKTVSLVFTEKTAIKPESVIRLAMRENKKYAITPDNRLNIRMNTITWTAVYEELRLLLKEI